MHEARPEPLCETVNQGILDEDARCTYPQHGRKQEPYHGARDLGEDVYGAVDDPEDVRCREQQRPRRREAQEDETRTQSTLRQSRVTLVADGNGQRVVAWA